jgi:hypothetical protein
VIAAVLALHLLLAAPSLPTAPFPFPSLGPVPVFSPPSFGVPTHATPQPVAPPRQNLVPANPRGQPTPVALPSHTTTSQDVGRFGRQIGGAVFLIGLGVVALTLLVVALLALKNRDNPNSRTHAILKSGLKALPALLLLLGGLVGLVIGVVYLMVLFAYLLVDFFIAIFVAAVSNKTLHLGGTEYGDLGGHMLLYFALGAVAFGLGTAWLAALGTRGLLRRQAAQPVVAGQAYEAAAAQPPAPPPPPSLASP